MDLNKVLIYRMTHIENIPHVLVHGITHRSSPNKNDNYKAIGDSSLINHRNRKNVFVKNGENEESYSVTIGDFIPFYFAPRMPMLYVVQRGGNAVPETTKPENIVYCVSSVGHVLSGNLDFIFSNGHATDNFSKFYSPKYHNEIRDKLDFDAINKKYWKDDNDLDLKRRKEAEFLVRQDIPVSLIVGYAVYSQEAMDRMVQLGIPKGKIGLRPQFYFKFR